MVTTAIEVIKAFEGCRLKAYQDQKGIWTIGYGATGPSIIEGLVWTQAQADNDLNTRVQELTVKIIPLVTNPLKSDSQVAAIIDFCYNCGLEAFRTSNLLKYINSGDWFSATKSFASWDHINQEENKGLLTRRLTEAVMFLKGS